MPSHPGMLSLLLNTTSCETMDSSFVFHGVSQSWSSMFDESFEQCQPVQLHLSKPLDYDGALIGYLDDSVVELP